MAELLYFTGTMDSGKSTLALQTNHNYAARGRAGRIFTSHDRAGAALVSSRLGLVHDALEVGPDLDFWHYVVDSLTHGARIDYLICDEAQFYTPTQVDQLARVVDELQIDVFAFGILSDFRTHLFEGSRRLVELADRMNTLQVEALCWCGKRATHNARSVNGEMVTEGAGLVVSLIPFPHPDAPDMPVGVTSPPIDDITSAPAHLIVGTVGLTGDDRARDTVLAKLTAAVLDSTDAVAAMLGHGVIFHRAGIFADAAKRALGASSFAASSCRKGDDPRGTAEVIVTFAPSGRVTSANVNGAPFGGTATGGCIAATLRGATVPPFAGNHVSVRKLVTVR